MSAKLRIWVLVLVTLCLQVPAGASLRVCLCGLESLFAPEAAACCAPVERTSCCAAAERGGSAQLGRDPVAQLGRDSTCHGSESCGCHELRAPERDGASQVSAPLPALEHALAPCTLATTGRAAPHATRVREPARRVCEPPGRRRNLPLRI